LVSPEPQMCRFFRTGYVARAASRLARHYGRFGVSFVRSQFRHGRHAFRRWAGLPESSASRIRCSSNQRQGQRPGLDRPVKRLGGTDRRSAPVLRCEGRVTNKGRIGDRYLQMARPDRPATCDVQLASTPSSLARAWLDSLPSGLRLVHAGGARPSSHPSETGLTYSPSTSQQISTSTVTSIVTGRARSAILVAPLPRRRQRAEFPRQQWTETRRCLLGSRAHGSDAIHATPGDHSSEEWRCWRHGPRRPHRRNADETQPRAPDYRNDGDPRALTDLDAAPG